MTGSMRRVHCGMRGDLQRLPGRRRTVQQVPSERHLLTIVNCANGAQPCANRHWSVRLNARASGRSFPRELPLVDLSRPIQSAHKTASRNVSRGRLLMLRRRFQKALKSQNCSIGFQLNLRTQHKPVDYREPQRRGTISEFTFEASSERG